MKLNFGQDVLVLPASVLQRSDVTAEQLRVLLWLASDPSLAQKSKKRQLAKLADCSAGEAECAVAYWKTHGILVEEREESVAVMASADTTDAKEVAGVPAKSPRKPLKRADELPNYTMTELSDLLEKRASLRELTNEAQQILGKIFNPSELNILVGMYDYLGLGDEAILLLLSHCQTTGRTNLRSIEKYAYTLIDRGITTADALEEEFRTVEALHSFEGEVRKLFGMKARALTTKEEKMLRAWVSFGYGMDVVKMAYETAVQATNEASMPYANAILERWHADGHKTATEIENAVREEREKRGDKKTQGKLGNSFDTDDFFRAALDRTFSDIKDGN